MAFQYRVRDTLGHFHDGELEASSVAEASLLLRRDGMQIVSLENEEDDDWLPRRVTRGEVIGTTNQLSVMVDTGITLSAALESILRQEQNPSLRRVLKGLKSSVEGGENFSSALARYPRYFDRTYVALIKASEATGTLGAMLERIGVHLRKEMETRSKVRSAMAYPTVMLVLAIAVTLFLLAFVLPRFTPLFERKGIELPTPTRVLIGLSELLLGYWYGWVLAALVALAAVITGRRTEAGRQTWDWIKINLPIMGPMFRKVIISRTIRTLGALLNGGISMLDALQLSAEVTGNIYYERLWRQVALDVTEGKQVCQGLAGSPLFPPMLVQMIAAGEQAGKLGPVMERVSNYYDQEVETALKTATSLIEPMMISVMGVIVGGIAMALLLPIFTLSRTPS